MKNTPEGTLKRAKAPPVSGLGPSAPPKNLLSPVTAEKRGSQPPEGRVGGPPCGCHPTPRHKQTSELSSRLHFGSPCHVMPSCASGSS